jgi:hypothetical protein
MAVKALIEGLVMATPPLAIELKIKLEIIMRTAF